MDYINPTREEFIEAYCEAKSHCEAEYEDTPQLRFKMGEVYDFLLKMVSKIPLPVYAEEVVYLDKLWELHKLWKSKDKGKFQDCSMELEFAGQKLLENYPE